MSDEPSYPKLARTTDRVFFSDADTGNMHAAVSSAGGKRPYDPPVIETSYRRSTGLPPDVIDEWSGKDPLRSETDDKVHHKLVRVWSKWSVRRWREVWRRAAVTLGLRKPRTARAD